MTVKVLFFSLLRDLSGTSEMTLVLEEDRASLGDVVRRIHDECPALRKWEGPTLFAVNAEFADGGTPVGDGDEIALMPPVQGG